MSKACCRHLCLPRSPVSVGGQALQYFACDKDKTFLTTSYLARGHFSQPSPSDLQPSHLDCILSRFLNKFLSYLLEFSRWISRALARTSRKFHALGSSRMVNCWDTQANQARPHSDFGAQITPFASRTFQFTKEQFGQAEDKVFQFSVDPKDPSSQLH